MAEQIPLIELSDWLERNGERVARLDAEGRVWTTRRHAGEDAPKPQALIGAEQALLAAFRERAQLYKDGRSPEERIKAGEAMLGRDPGNEKVRQLLVWLRQEDARTWEIFERALKDYEEVCGVTDGTRWPLERETQEYLDGQGQVR